MYKKIILLILIIIIAFQIYSSNKTVETMGELYNYNIIIDAGHGGVDGGAEGFESGVKESELNLKIALILKDYLKSSGLNVIMIREEDVGLYTDGSIRSKKNEDLKNRVDIFNNSENNIVLSIHLNSFSGRQYYGVQTFYNKSNVNSELLAKHIQKQMKSIIDNSNDRQSLTKNDVYIMKHTTNPLVIIECGFLSNIDEEKLLQTKEYQNLLAFTIYTGILNYIDNIADI